MTPATLKQTRKLLNLFGDDPSTEEVQNILGNGDLIVKMLGTDLSKVDRKAFEALLNPVVPFDGSYPSWYVSPQQQLANVTRWNRERNWGFIPDDFSIGVPQFKPTSPLEVLVLAVYLPDKGKGKAKVPGYVRTFTELWEIAASQQPGKYQNPDLKLDAEHLRLLEGTEERHEPGIRWVVVDLGAHHEFEKGREVRKVRGKDSAHAEVLAAAAHFPGWIQAMDGKTVPYVDIAGYELTFPGGDPWRRVPWLYWYRGGRRIRLSARWLGGVSSASAPVVRDLPAGRQA